MGIFSFCAFPRSCHGQSASDTPDEIYSKTTSKPLTETHLNIPDEPATTAILVNDPDFTASIESNSSARDPSPQAASPIETDPTKKLLDKKTSFSTLTAWQILAYNVVNSSELPAIPEETEHHDDLPPPPPMLPPSPPLQSPLGSILNLWSTDKVETHYEILDQLGFGAFGKVYKAKRISDGALACVKIINVPGVSETVAEEISTLHTLRHPHIVSLYGAYCGDNEERTAIAMELCAAGDLEKWLKHRNRGKSLISNTSPQSALPLPLQQQNHLSEAEIMHCFVQVLIALQHIHSHGILHRDIKTSNIFLSTYCGATTSFDTSNNATQATVPQASGETITTNSSSPSIFDYLLKMGDFGIAKSLEPGQSCAKTMVGTPCYFSPELISDQPYNKKTDVWAIGCVLYELCALKRPFQGNSVSAVCVKILAGAAPQLPSTCSAELVKLVELLLTKDPRKRPSINAVLGLPFVQKYYEVYKEWRKERGLGSIEEESQKSVDQKREVGAQNETRTQSHQIESQVNSQIIENIHSLESAATIKPSSSSSLKQERSSSSQDLKNMEAVTVKQRTVNKIGSWGRMRRQAEGECREELDDSDGEVQYVFAS